MDMQKEKIVIKKADIEKRFGVAQADIKRQEKCDIFSGSNCSISNMSASQSNLSVKSSKLSATVLQYIQGPQVKGFATPKKGVELSSNDKCKSEDVKIENEELKELVEDQVDNAF